MVGVEVRNKVSKFFYVLVVLAKSQGGTSRKNILHPIPPLLDESNVRCFLQCSAAIQC